MAVKPLDIQVNISHMHEVAKGEQGRYSAMAEMQQVLEKESHEKSKDVQSRLEENKKAERTLIMREEKSMQKRGRKRRGGHEMSKRNKKLKGNLNDGLGLFVDIKK